jgi:hypothetical protein
MDFFVSLPWQRMQHSQKKDSPNSFQKGDVGTWYRGGHVGRAYWDGFTIIEVISPKRLRVEFDKPILIGDEQLTATPAEGGGWYYSTPPENKIRVLEFRRPGKWMFQGVPAKKMHGHIKLGEKKTGAEEGQF